MLKGLQKLTDSQALVLSIYTGLYLCDMDRLCEAYTEALGRPAMTHDLANPEIRERMKELYRPLFLSILPEGVV